jgi:ferredoxin--NADP+ reductase
VPRELREPRVISQGKVAEGLFLLRLERSGPQSRSFTAGQVLGITVDPSIPPRLYSIASGESEPHFEILYSVEEEGLLTPRLAGLSAGDRLFISGPSGNFAAPPVPSVWVAGGTGIAPFVSMLRSGQAAPGTVTIHAAPSVDAFYGRNEFEASLGPAYLRCSSRAAAGDPACFQGRATALIESRPDLPLDRPWLLCGPTSFVVDTRDFLIRRGLPYSFVRAEVYF